ncbi:hypothetical protein BJ138DRAFT_1005295 [Hygrophoropsis aurantiaca]|uniref:Uncharacterized protein n=1 Tax=Hygrophoropsis aurantiaca TaxID=72124 RepID=A0ACB8AH32_9AGAM|nr:hypothetical protein BJ138DRAFT_1005295 [Hygrophoropsis aurantiaca]
MYTLADLVQRRTVLQESIISWTNGATQLQTTRTSTPSPTWLAQYEQTQFEIKRRQELMVKLNNAITQMSAQAHPETRVQVPPPLDKPRFDAAYGNYCRGKGIEINTKIIMPDIRIPVLELYQLHVAVMREGSFAKVVNAADSWHIVGGKLGFAQNAPVVPTEPLRSTPEIATHLQRVYKDRLEHFDYLYISSVIGAVRKRAAEQNKQNTQIPALAPV